ncbi:hypothetical protein HQ32_00024 [Prauserella sp. Am3]|nr:hypothetical protein HQ32_00024 [Prauserella sp. Am3]
MGTTERRRRRSGAVAIVAATAVVLLTACGGQVAGTAEPQSGDSPPAPTVTTTTATTTPAGGTADGSAGDQPPDEETPAGEGSPATTDVTSSKDLRDVDDSTDIDPCSLMPMDVLKRGGEFTRPEHKAGSCFSSEPSLGVQVAIEFSEESLPDVIERSGLQLGNIHGRAAAEYDMTSQDLGCQVIMEMNPDEVVRVLFDGTGQQDCAYAASVATAVETKLSQG